MPLDCMRDLPAAQGGSSEALFLELLHQDNLILVLKGALIDTGQIRGRGEASVQSLLLPVNF